MAWLRTTSAIWLLGRGVYAFLLNPQGRILAICTVFNMGETLDVETDRSQVEKIFATFDHYIIMDDVEVRTISAKWTVSGVAGPKARIVGNAAGSNSTIAAVADGYVRDALAIAAALNARWCAAKMRRRNRTRSGLSRNDVYKTWQALVAAGATPVGSEALEMQRVLAGVPLYGVDIRERDLPQETEQMRALNFNKGCYVGQEIVERIRSRGNVHRKFTGFLGQGTAEISASAKILSDDKEVGEVTSAASFATPGGQRTVALGYIRREVGVPGRDVLIGTMPARVISLPVQPIALPVWEDVALHKV
jgi:folate-binding protein YgfZ